MKLTYNEMEQIATNLGSNADLMNSTLDEVKTLFNKIGTDGVWAGDAANEVKSEFNSLSGEFENFVKSIRACQTYINQVVANYKSVDAKIAEIGK